MRIANLFPVIGLLAAVATAQHGNYVVPEVEQIVQYMFQIFESWITCGPQPNSYPESTNDTSSPSTNQTASSSYWLEDIKHQGISAFNPNNYTVFRNVKDYGAKGVNILSLCSQFRTPPYLPSFTFMIDESKIIDLKNIPN